MGGGGHEALPEVQKQSGGPNESPGEVKRSTHRAERGQEPLAVV